MTTLAVSQWITCPPRAAIYLLGSDAVNLAEWVRTVLRAAEYQPEARPRIESALHRRAGCPYEPRLLACPRRRRTNRYATRAHLRRAPAGTAPVTERYVAIITALLDDAGINYLSITGRTKSVASFAAKAVRRSTASRCTPTR